MSGCERSAAPPNTNTNTNTRRLVSPCDSPETPAKGQDAQVDTSFSDSSLFSHWGQDLSPDERRVALKMFQYYGYNGYLSDRLSLERPIADLRPDG